jgi:hypothetical protein
VGGGGGLHQISVTSVKKCEKPGETENYCEIFLLNLIYLSNKFTESQDLYLFATVGITKYLQAALR